MIKEIVLIFAATFGATAVILGAFGAHALKKRFTESQLNSFEIGVKYQMYHAILLLLIGTNFPMVSTLETIMVLCFIIGVILFSFSIYGLCITASSGRKVKILGPITPLGGLLLLTGWVLLLVYVIIYGLNL